MADPMDPIPPTTSPSSTGSGAGTSSTGVGTGTSTTPGTTGLPSNVAAALACIPLIGGLIFYIIEKHDNFVRFYAMQSIIFGGAWMLFNIVSSIIHLIFSPIPAVGPILIILWSLFSALVHLGFLVIFVITVVKAFTGVRWDIPFIGPMARKQVDGTV